MIDPIFWPNSALRMGGDVQRPQCPDHPNGRVWRDGKYGKRKQYQRWKCVPRAGGRPHVFQPVLPKKGHGTQSPGCIECGRPFQPGEGMATGLYDRFSLREKARALARLSEGSSYRRVAHDLRYQTGEVREGPHGLEASRDGRMTRDWISHYIHILAETHLPSMWPEVLLLDSLPFHVRAKNPDGSPKKGGRRAFVVLAALSYGQGTVHDAEASGRTPILWRVQAHQRSRAGEWSRFLWSLPGQPEYVVCDQEKGLLTALRQVWPETAVYACSHHLQAQVLEQLRRADLLPTPLADTVHHRTFIDMTAYEAFLSELDISLAAGLPVRQQNALHDLDNWVAGRHEAVVRSIEEFHEPRSTGALESYLRSIKEVLYDRRALFKNLDRLDALLTLCQLRLNGFANDAVWAAQLEQAVEAHLGRLPGRRNVDRSPRRLC